MRRGLTKIQIICIVFLWVAFCVMMFVIPSGKSMTENIIIAIVSGIIIFVAVSKDNTRHRNRRRG